MGGSTDIVLEADDCGMIGEVSGVIEVDDLAVGNTTLVWVSHSSTPLALAQAPVFSLTDGDVDDIELRVVEKGEDEDGVMRATDGSGFLLEVTVAGGATGADKGRGTSAYDWDINYTRRGILE